MTTPRRASPARKRIMADVTSAIRAGEMRPGDRLPGVGRMRKRYGCGQNAVERALEALVDDGLLEVRRRSGTYVTLEAPHLLDDGAPGGDPNGATPSLDYFLPRSAGSTLSVYVSDFFPECLSVWRETVSEFGAGRPETDIRLASFAEGHLEELWPTRRFDLVETTPGILRRIGMPLAEVPPVRIMSEDACLPPVRRWLERGGGRWGQPFSLTVVYLYANLDLLSAAGASVDPPRNTTELLDAARTVRDSGLGDGLALCDLWDWSLLTGAVRTDPDDGAAYDTRRAVRAYAELAGGAVTHLPQMQEEKRFLDGTLAFALLCSFFIPRFREDAPFRWTAWAPPAVEDATLPGYLTVLAMPRDCSERTTALDLIRHLESPETQTRFGELRGNIPASAGPRFESDRWCDAETVRRTMRQTVADPGDEETHRLRRCFAPPHLLHRLLDGTQTPESTAADIAAALRKTGAARS